MLSSLGWKWANQGKGPFPAIYILSSGVLCLPVKGREVCFCWRPPCTHLWASADQIPFWQIVHTGVHSFHGGHDTKLQTASARGKRI